jgi:hypothetical protein
LTDSAIASLSHFDYLWSHLVKVWLMVIRKWFIRALMLLLTLLVGGAYYVYGQYTNPDAIAQLVLEELQEHFPGADIQLGHADWRLFGGVRLNELRITPADQRGHSPTAIFRQTVIQIDKGQAARGKFELQRVHLDHPQLNIERDEQGHWNILDLLTSKPKETGTIPFVTLHNGSIRFLDRKLDFPILELKEVEAKLTPQPLGVLTSEGTGHSDLLGKIDFRLIHQPASKTTELTISIPRIEYQPALEHLIVKLVPTWHEQRIRLQGVIALETKLTWLGQQDIPTVKSSLHLAASEFCHARIPVPLRDIQAQLEYNQDTLVLNLLSAKADGGTITGHGRVDLAADFQEIKNHQATIHIDYENVRLHAGVYPFLPPVLRKFCTEFQTMGLMNGDLDLSWKNQKLGIAYTLKPHQGSFEPDEFPYPAHDVNGSLRYDETGEQPILHLDLQGKFAQRPFTLQGRLFGIGLRPDNGVKPGIDFTVVTDTVPLDEALTRALQPYPETQRVIRQFHAQGTFDCKIRVHRDAGTQEGERPLMKRWVTAQLKDMQLRFEPFPCPLEKVSGQLDINPDKTWRITNFVGEHHGGKIAGLGWLTSTSGGDILHLEINAKNAPFSPELLAALPQDVQQVWKHFRPQGRADCKVIFDKLEKGKPNVDVTLNARTVRLQPVCFPYALERVKGGFHYANNQVELRALTAEHKTASISLADAHVTIRPGHGFFAQLQGIAFNQLSADDDLLNALPGMLREAVATMRPNKSMNVHCDLDIEDPGENLPAKLTWSGSVELQQTRLQCGCAFDNISGLILLDHGVFDHGKLETNGRLFLNSLTIADKQALGPVSARIHLTNDQLQLHECRGQLANGLIKGLLEVKFGAEPRFHLDLGSEAPFQLEQLISKPDGPKGRAHAKLILNGEGSSLRNLQGNGSVYISDGANLYQLPLIVDIFNQFSQMLPKATNLQEAKLDFTIQGDRLIADRVQLLADAYKIDGNGSAHVDGSYLNLALTLVPGAGRTFPLMPAALDKVQTSFAKGLMKVQVSGSIDKVEVQVEPFPFMVEPFKNLFRSLSK